MQEQGGIDVAGKIVPRQWTQKEMRDMFLDHIWGMVKYWSTVESKPMPHEPNPQPKTVEERLDGLAFSILVMLDGCSGGMPAFELYPAPHPADKEYCQDQGENWWPQLEDLVSIHGESSLHDEWGKLWRSRDEKLNG